MLLAQVLSLALFLLGAEWVIGGFALLLFADLQGEISGAFLGRYALIFLTGTGFTAWLRAQYPGQAVLQEIGVQTAWLGPEQRAFTLFLVLLALYSPVHWFGLVLIRRVIGGLVVLAGVATLVYSGLAYGHGPWAGVGTIVNLFVASLVLGAATMGLAIGHSYLSEPQLTSRPLRYITTLLIIVLVVQVLSLPIYLGLVGSRAATQGREMLDVYGMILGVRVVIGLLFPLLLAALAWHTARIRAMRSATGLLYIGMGIVATGEIVAKVLFFAGGLPV